MSEVKKIEECYRRLIVAIVEQAIKDRAEWFLESPGVKSYCTAAGITRQFGETTRPVRARGISHNAGGTRQRGNENAK